jgi:CDP-diacylglycerol pyrophosphatase
MHSLILYLTIGLAINSANVRSQDQLHIHIACLASSAISELKGKAASIGKGAWKPKIVPFQSLTNHGPYNAIGVPDLSTSPFEQLLKNPDIFSSPSDSQHGMADQTVVVTQIPGGDYYILARPSGSGEELLTNCP